jgi:hypothetical protein
MRGKSIIAAAVACMITAATTTLGARAETVDMLLVLAADVSRSIDDREFTLQRQGYATALTDPRVLQAIAGGPNNAIAITFVEWASADEQKIVVDWTVVRDEEGAAGIAAAMQNAPRSFIGRTSISAAIDFAMERLRTAPAEAEKRIIDISADGTNNSGRSLTEARDEAVAAGVTINALAIVNQRDQPGYAIHTQPPGGLGKYFAENVIGGPGAFMLEVDGFESFAEGITRKLVAEIAGRSPTTAPAAQHAALP